MTDFTVVSLIIGADIGTLTTSASANGVEIVAGKCAISRIRLENKAAAAITVLLFDGAGNATNRRYLGTYNVPYFSDSGLVRNDVDIHFPDPLKIVNGLYAKTANATGCYVIPFAPDGSLAGG